MSRRVGHVYVVHTTLTKPDPKDKIVVCVCGDAPPLFVWFNSRPQAHGFGQLACGVGDHPALTRNCYLDLSRVTTFAPIELAAALDRGPLSDAMKRRICGVVQAGIVTLAPRYAKLIVDSLSA